MKVKVLIHCVGTHENHWPGTVIDVPDSDGQRLLDAGLAELVVVSAVVPTIVEAPESKRKKRFESR